MHHPQQRKMGWKLLWYDESFQHGECLLMSLEEKCWNVDLSRELHVLHYRRYYPWPVLEEEHLVEQEMSVSAKSDHTQGVDMDLCQHKQSMRDAVIRQEK